jgi:hypothetical protein
LKVLLKPLNGVFVISPEIKYLYKDDDCADDQDKHPEPHEDLLTSLLDPSQFVTDPSSPPYTYLFFFIRA